MTQDEAEKVIARLEVWFRFFRPGLVNGDEFQGCRDDVAALKGFISGVAPISAPRSTPIHAENAVYLLNLSAIAADQTAPIPGAEPTEEETAAYQELMRGPDPKAVAMMSDILEAYSQWEGAEASAPGSSNAVNRWHLMVDEYAKLVAIIRSSAKPGEAG